MDKFKRLFQAKEEKQTVNKEQNKDNEEKGHFYVTGPGTGFYRPKNPPTRKELVEMFKNAG